MFALELEVFYDTSDFAVQCTASPSGAVFAGTLSTVEDERFGGQAMAGVHALQYPTGATDLRKGHQVTTQAGTEPQQHWEVLRTPDRIVDGHESLALLTPKAV